MYLYIAVFTSPADIRDVLLYASHPDPQLKGNCSLIIGNFITTVLMEGRGDFSEWTKQWSNLTTGLLQ